MTFDIPDRNQMAQAIERFLGPDAEPFENWLDVMALTFAGESLSDIERELRRFRRALTLGTASVAELVEAHAVRSAGEMDHGDRIELAVRMTERTALSQHRISDLTGVSRDMIRKRAGPRASAPRPVARARAARWSPPAS